MLLNEDGVLLCLLPSCTYAAFLHTFSLFQNIQTVFSKKKKNCVQPFCEQIIQDSIPGNKGVVLKNNLIQVHKRTNYCNYVLPPRMFYILEKRMVWYDYLGQCKKKKKLLHPSKSCLNNNNKKLIGSFLVTFSKTSVSVFRKCTLAFISF